MQPSPLYEIIIQFFIEHPTCPHGMQAWKLSMEITPILKQWILNLFWLFFFLVKTCLWRCWRLYIARQTQKADFCSHQTNLVIRSSACIELVLNQDWGWVVVWAVGTEPNPLALLGHQVAPRVLHVLPALRLKRVCPADEVPTRVILELLQHLKQRQISNSHLQSV